MDLKINQIPQSKQSPNSVQPISKTPLPESLIVNVLKKGPTSSSRTSFERETAYMYLLGVYLSHGQLMNSIINDYLAANDAAKVGDMGSLRVLLYRASDQSKQLTAIFAAETKRLHDAGIGSDDSEADALIGLQHVFATATNTPNLGLSVVLRENLQQIASMQKYLDAGMASLELLRNQLNLIPVHGTNLDYFLFSSIRSQY